MAGHETSPPSTADDSSSAQDGRSETVNEQMDRNWNEMLQELRVMQTGVQIIAGFLLTLPFQQRFSSLSGFEHGLYLALVLLASTATGLMLLPVSLHRRLFRHQQKERLVAAGDRIVKVVLGGVALLIAGSTTLIFSVVGGANAATAAGSGLFIVLVVLLLVYPLVAGHQRRRS